MKFIEIEDAIINVNRIDHISMPVIADKKFEIEVFLANGREPIVWEYDSFLQAEEQMDKIRTQLNSIAELV